MRISTEGKPFEHKELTNELATHLFGTTIQQITKRTISDPCK